jgi:DNA polymerase III subunit epsilon
MPTFAVIDVETTGLNKFRCDRIVKVAVVLLTPGNGIIAEFSTLLNPDRDIGPTRIHGLTAGDVANAPRFEQIAAELTEFLRKTSALAGHNVQFDLSFLRCEYERMGVPFPTVNLLDTMLLSGGKSLEMCCAERGLNFDGRMHAALCDARVTARLLDQILSDNPNLISEFEESPQIQWPFLQSTGARPFPRERIGECKPEQPSYIQKLAAHLPRSAANLRGTEAENGYRVFLYRALEDGRVTPEEGESLVEVAIRSGLSQEQVEKIHSEYLTDLARTALADGIVTDFERRELESVAHSLGIAKSPEFLIEDLLRALTTGKSGIVTAPVASEEWAGKTVCFTGECLCRICGKYITRDEAERIAIEKGMIVLANVTKKLNILVVADPDSKSGKAKKAQQYGIRIMHEPVFWRRLGVPIE